MANLSNASIGLSILSRNNVLSQQANSAFNVESQAVRKARAAFKTEPVTPPWRAKPSTASASTELAAVKAMRSIIDRSSSGIDPDIQTTFTSYKALDRLRVLAEAAAKSTTGTAERVSLQKAFGAGMAELQTFLAKAPSSLIDLSFERAASRAQTVAVASPSSLNTSTIAGGGILATRFAPLPGVTGTERFRIDLADGAARDSVVIDLAAGPQPPTLDSLSTQINDAIKTMVRLDQDGVPVVDGEGRQVPRYAVTAVPAKTGEKWGLNIERGGFETIAIDQIDAGDAIMVANGTIASGPTGASLPTTALVSRFDDPTGAMTRRTLATFAATDEGATERLKMVADADTTKKIKAVDVGAATSVGAVATDALGFSYVVGTTSGDLGGNLSDGGDDLYLTKLDSEGQTVWRRTLGVGGTATGAAVTIAPDGGIVVAGSVTGGFAGDITDGDMLVARYDSQGEESFSTLVRAVGVDTAGAVAVGADGTIYVGGQTDRNGGDAVLTRFGADGKLAERRVLVAAGSGSVKALAVGKDGALLAVTSDAGRATLRKIDGAALTGDLVTLDLGVADARAIAVAADGGIVVAGATDATLEGAQVNARSGSRDAFVARVDAGLAGAEITYLGTGEEDQADSVSILGGAIYVGGRTAGALAGAKNGTVDAFVARIDAATGTVGRVSQFGTTGTRTEPVQVVAVKGGNSALGAIGLHRGTLTPTDSVTLPAQTSLRAGDEFGIRLNNGAVRKITIVAGETLTTLANRVRTLIGTRAATVTTPATGDGRALRIDMKAGQELELIAGGTGKDALPKLGLDARRIAGMPIVDEKAPKVRPGGSFGLDLSDAMQIGTKADAAASLGRIKQAISTSQSAYRSLYWDDVKALLVDTPAGSKRKAGSTAVETAQLANYRSALARLTGSTGSSYGF
jgi:CBS domain-containing protein